LLSKEDCKVATLCDFVDEVCVVLPCADSIVNDEIA
jgi:hypothetical protein